MIKTELLFFCIISLLFSSYPCLAIEENPAWERAGWDLVWHDEFDGKSIDGSKWTVRDYGDVRNNELQYYTPEEVYIENGNLVIRSQKRRFKDKRYTSGRLETRDKFYIQYGYFEIRAKLPETKGIWAAHWMMPQDRVWPPEIDITECLGQEPDRVYFAYHYGDPAAPLEKSTSYKNKTPFANAFHTFALEWTEDSLTWYVDGKQRFQVKREEVTQFPEKPFYMILNTAVGGTWPGNPNKNTVFPQYHSIDYVRIYQKTPDPSVDDFLLYE